MTGTEGDVLASERLEWGGLPFVDGGNAWAPARCTGSEQVIYAAEWSLGARYALDLIAHMRVHLEVDTSESLSVIVEAMTGTKLGNIERGFLDAITEFVAKGSVSVGLFDARLAVG